MTLALTGIVVVLYVTATGCGPEAEPDIVLTPLLAFDAAMNRLGQGAGHYDRVFERLPDAWRIGIAWSVQQVEHIVTDPWDMPLHGVITEAAAWGEAAA